MMVIANSNWHRATGFLYVRPDLGHVGPSHAVLLLLHASSHRKSG